MKHLTACLLLLLLLLSSAAAEYAPGDTLLFGRYPQDNRSDTPPEPIRWTVLQERDGNLLLLSSDILDAIPYNETYGDITWEACSLRTWLNQVFYSAAFTPEERQAILLTAVDNSSAQRSPRFKTNGGADTQDYIFVLSYAEAASFFTSDQLRRCAPTDYALSRGALTSGPRAGSRLSGLWWLRSPGNHQYRVSVVYSSGMLNYTYATKPSGGIRPALWLNPALIP